MIEARSLGRASSGLSGGWRGPGELTGSSPRGGSAGSRVLFLSSWPVDVGDVLCLADVGVVKPSVAPIAPLSSPGGCVERRARCLSASWLCGSSRGSSGRTTVLSLSRRREARDRRSWLRTVSALSCAMRRCIGTAREVRVPVVGTRCRNPPTSHLPSSWVLLVH